MSRISFAEGAGIIPNHITFKDIEPSCSVCVYSKEIAGTGDLLCQKKGVVSAHYKCRKFEVNSLVINTRRRRGLQVVKENQDDFSIY